MKEQEKVVYNKEAGKYKKNMTPQEYNMWLDDFLVLGMSDKNKNLIKKYEKEMI